MELSEPSMQRLEGLPDRLSWPDAASKPIMVDLLEHDQCGNLQHSFAGISQRVHTDALMKRRKHGALA